MDISSPTEYQEDKDLPQCKIKRNYACSHCLYFTQNPRFYLTHLRDIHGERITINNCSLCLYASRHYQKLVRHMKMVHGSTADGIPGQLRKRPLVEDIFDAVAIPPLPPPSKWVIDIDHLSYDLKSSRKTLKEIAAIYFATNEINEILAEMEASDVVEVVPVRDDLYSRAVSIRTVFGDPKGELDITCSCGYISQCILDLLIHGKSCTKSKENSIKNVPLDLRLSDKKDSTLNQTNGIKVEQLVNERNSLNNYWNDNIGEIGNGGLRCYKPVFEHSKKPENKTDELRMKMENYDHLDEVEDKRILTIKEEKTIASHKRVFKCDLCPFWASTASRFHVHIVGHQNKKPFKCSLCAYCSNWRWDITKHIRLRALRSPSHKNARVLMQGENGRRNYSKYDRFINLLKISGHDGDLKSRKCGEITSNDKYSKVIANKLHTEELEKRTFKEVLKGDQQKPNLKPENVKATEVVSNTRNVKQNNNCTRTVQGNPRSYLILEHGDNPVYKCSNCNFRHPNRDAVLVHVKIQHQELFKSSMVSKFSKTTGNCYEDPKLAPCEEVASFSGINQQSKNNIECTIVDDDNDHTATVLNSKTDFSSMEKLATARINSTVKDSSENKDKMGVVKINSRDSSPCSNKFAPFRCWHCHQTSNWKHVIQRHCRLKHSGSIRIEALDRSIDANNPSYHMLNLSSNSNENPGIHPQETESSIKRYDDMTLKYSKKSLMNIKRAEEKVLSFKCKNCPYVCTNKVQLIKHFTQKHQQSNIVCKKSKKPCDREKSVNSTAISAGNKEISQKNNITLEKCNYCSFSSSCQSAMKCHEQSHYRVILNQGNSQIGKSGIKEEATSNFKHPMSNHQTNLELAVKMTDNIQKMENLSITKDISLTKVAEVNRQMDKIDKEIQRKIKNNKIPSLNSNNGTKTFMVPLPSQPSHKTIFVNAKTGQVVRRN